jgi:hypothetical protein
MAQQPKDIKQGGKQVYEPGVWDVPEIPIHERQYRHADPVQLERHLNRGDHMGQFLGNLDDVDRRSWPSPGELETNIVGANDPDRPDWQADSTSTMNRAPRIPTRSGAGDFSRSGNSHPLNAGGSPARHGQNKA